MNAGTSGNLIAIFILLIVIAAVIAGVIGLVMLIRSRNKPGDSGLCGKCGYSVTGLTHFECPECGSDLRQVGISKETGGRSAVAIVLILVGVLAMGCVCATALFGWTRAATPAGPITVPVAPPPPPPPPINDDETSPDIETNDESTDNW